MLHSVKSQIPSTAIKTLRRLLTEWYLANKRDLPWRSSRDPYRIWISEVMLQQTTVSAVRPFYEKFMLRFPTLKSLATASIEDVYVYWAGLGYYSRARNLHKSAQLLWEKVQSGDSFPNSAAELILFPGFGPYTSRAVSSLAFDEPVGVLDGNVIRILTRQFGLDVDWWLPQYRNELQTIADLLADTKISSDVNQGMMELGATICTPRNPLCLSCPWKKSCVSFAKSEVTLRPKSKPRPVSQIWEWNFYVERKGDRIFLVDNAATPFLKGSPFPVSEAKKITKKPKTFTFKHSVTKYDIYVNVIPHQPQSKPASRPKNGINRDSMNGRWINANQISELNPTSLMKKILSHLTYDSHK